MENKLLSLLGLARRAGKVEPGFDAAVGAAQSGKAALLLAAGDISEKTVKNLRYEGDRAGIPTLRVSSGMEALGQACGMRAGVLALIVSALYTMYRQCPKYPVSYCIMAGSFIAAALLQVNVLLVIILCGTAGLISASVMNRRAKK